MDLIKREDAIKAIDDMQNGYDGWTDRFDKAQIIQTLEDPTIVPSADRPQGEWIDGEIPLESGGSMPIQACNLCKTFYPLAYTGGGHRFCPNCGARMKGAADE